MQLRVTNIHRREAELLDVDVFCERITMSCDILIMEKHLGWMNHAGNTGLKGWENS